MPEMAFAQTQNVNWPPEANWSAAASLRRQAPELEYARYAAPRRRRLQAPVGGWRNSGSKLRMKQDLREQHNGEGQS